MTREEYIREFEKLRKKLPESKMVIISYYGEGGNIDLDLNSINGKFENIDYSIHEYNNLIFAALDRSEADFSGDGCNGLLYINLENNTIMVENYIRVVEEIASGGLIVNPDNIEENIHQNDDQIIM